MLRVTAQLQITARMYIGAPSGRLGLRGAAARRSATWPFALVGLRATSHTCDTLYAIAETLLDIILVPLDVITVLRYYSTR